MPSLIEWAARNAETWADDAADMRQALGELHAEHPSFPHLARAERRLHEAAAELLVAAELYAEH